MLRAVEKIGNVIDARKLWEKVGRAKDGHTPAKAA
jgi:hypothetical protein